MRWTSLVLVLGLTACADATSSVPPADQPAPADILDVACDGSTTTVDADAVQARTDGVHLYVENTSADELLIDWDSGGDGAKPGRSSFVFPIPPGEGKVRCQSLHDDPGSPDGWATFNVAAPAGWVSPELQCPGGMVNGNADYAPGAIGTEDPLADARKHADGLEVRQAGYRTDDNVTFVGLENGVPTHSFGYASDGQGGWLLTTTDACS